MPPLRMLGIRRRAWCEEDRVLAAALELDDMMRCSGCGQYTDEAHGDLGAGRYEVEDTICHACAALQEHDRADEKPPAGTVRWAVDVEGAGMSVTENPHRQKG